MSACTLKLNSILFEIIINSSKCQVYMLTMDFRVIFTIMKRTADQCPHNLNSKQPFFIHVHYTLYLHGVMYLSFKSMNLSRRKNVRFFQNIKHRSLKIYDFHNCKFKVLTWKALCVREIHWGYLYIYSYVRRDCIQILITIADYKIIHN